jgi:hypothetical protein
MTVLKQRLREEQERRAQDIETIRKMRGEFLHPPMPKKSARELYREMLKQAGQVCSENDPQFSRYHG